MNPLASLALLATVLVGGWAVTATSAEAAPDPARDDLCMDYSLATPAWDHC
jgi:hypothetical protein